MADHPASKTRIPVDPIQLEVLGGTFTVREVFAEPGEDAETVLETIRTTNAERWFVMLAEGEETSLDVLALIDDAFEFHSVAAGTLQGD
jgi:hypothetical protein